MVFHIFAQTLDEWLFPRTFHYARFACEICGTTNTNFHLAVGSSSKIASCYSDPVIMAVYVCMWARDTD